MRSIIVIATLLLVPIFLLAEESDTTKNYNLNPVTVTATQTEIPRNLVAPSISVVTADDIKANPDKSIFTLLSQSVPGVFVTERDVLGFGVSSPSGQITIRGIGGSPNNQVLTLIDGRPQYMGWYGHPINDSYLSANVDRVEIIRGPASMLYGSNAMGGVINIITHGTQQDGVSGDASVSYGSNDAQQYGMHLGYQKDKWNILGSFTHEHTDGARDWSEYTANSGYLKSSYQMNEQYRFSIDGSFTQFNTFDPGQITAPDTNNWMHIQRGYVGAMIENDFGISKGGIRFAYNFGHHELDPRYNFGWVSDDHLTAVNLFQSFSLLANNTVTVGVDVQQNGGNGSNMFGDLGNHSIEDYAGYVSVQQLFVERLLANAGVRFVHNSYFGDIVVPQAGLTYTVTEGTNLRASVSRGYRAPQIFELHQLSPISGTLEPEKLWNYEVGFSRVFAQIASIDVAGFIIDADNTIFDAWYMMKAVNTGGYHRSGFECSVQLIPMDDMKLNASYSYNDKPDVAQSVPKHKAYFGGEYHWQRMTASVGAQYVNTLYGWDSQFFILKKLSDYINVDAHIAVQVMEKVSVSVGSQNLLDESFQTIYSYPMPGRTFTVGVQAGI